MRPHPGACATQIYEAVGETLLFTLLIVAGGARDFPARWRWSTSWATHSCARRSRSCAEHQPRLSSRDRPAARATWLALFQQPLLLSHQALI